LKSVYVEAKRGGSHSNATGSARLSTRPHRHQCANEYGALAVGLVPREAGQAHLRHQLDSSGSPPRSPKSCSTLHALGEHCHAEGHAVLEHIEDGPCQPVRQDGIGGLAPVPLLEPLGQGPDIRM
jgi:hypothetical protein